MEFRISFTSLIFCGLLFGIDLYAQEPIKIHDLQSLTDTLGIDHLFYRIYEEYEDSDYYLDNIYQYHTETKNEELFLETYYDSRYGFPYAVAAIDYAFLDNDPENVVYIIRYCDNECSDYISRSDSIDIFGGLFITIDNLNVEGTDSGRVYVEALEETIIGKNGGREWPEIDEESGELPDSSVLNFPLVSLSPYNDSLMFGIHYRYGASDNRFVLSKDRGKTEEIVSDTLFGSQIQFDADSNTIYILDTINAPGSGKNCSLEHCDYGLYLHDVIDDASVWNRARIFDYVPNLLSHPNIHGRLYIWNEDSILVSKNYGNNFELLIDPDESITGFTVTASGEYYSTISKVFEWKDGESIEITSIPVFNEWEEFIPVKTELIQNYPNPFNPTTSIEFSLPDQSMVSLKVFDLLGREVADLVNEVKSAGEYSINFDASALSSGVYIYQLRAGNQVFSNRMTLLK